MKDYSHLNVQNVDELFRILQTELGDISSKWWKENRTTMTGYLRSLAEAAIQTRLALEQKRISPQAADIILHNQELAFNQTLQFTKFMTLALGQRLLDTTFAIIGAAIYSRTGINLTPNLLKTP